MQQTLIYLALLLVFDRFKNELEKHLLLNSTSILYDEKNFFFILELELEIKEGKEVTLIQKFCKKKKNK